MIERNAGLPPERRIEFRVGIHLGDVVEESDGDLMAWANCRGLDPLPIDAPHHVEFELDVLDLSCRAQVDPAKPPPITTTLAVPCATAGALTSAAEAHRRPNP